MLLWRLVSVNSQAVFASDDCDFCVQTNFKWLLVTMPEVLIAHGLRLHC